MKRELTLTHDPIAESASQISDGMGAVVTFHGVVRGTEDGEDAQTERYGTEGDGCLPYHTGPKAGKRDRRFLRVIETIKPDVFA